MVSQGDYVQCAVTGDRVDLANLRYWSVDLQEPYVSADVSMKRYLETQPES